MLPPLSQDKFVYLGLNIAWSENTDLSEGDLPLSIYYKQRRHSTHTKMTCSLSSYLTHYVKPDHIGPAIQLPFQPIHDRLRHQARTSQVRIELNHCRLASSQHPI